MIEVIIHGSNSVVLAGWASIIDDQPNLQVIGSSYDQTSLTALIDRQPDLLLLERSDDDWWEELPLSQFDLIMLTDSITAEEIDEYIELGVRGFLPRLTEAKIIIAAIDAVMAGLIVIHPEFALSQSNSAITPLPESEIALTPREMEVLQLLAAGLDNRAIASRLTISKHTVKFHISSIFSKLDVSSRTEAVTQGLRQGLILL